MEDLVTEINAVIESGDDNFEVENYILGSSYTLDCTCELSKEKPKKVCDCASDCRCPRINKKLKELEENGKVYRIGSGFYNRIDYCETCADKFKEMFEYIDRREYTEEEKPRIWPCQFCHIREKSCPQWNYSGYTSRHYPEGTLLGGGTEWYYSKEYQLDCCMECWNALSGRELLPRMAFEPGKSYIQTERSDPPLIFLKPEFLKVEDLYDPSDLFQGQTYFRLDPEFASCDDYFPTELVEVCGIDTFKENIFSWVRICPISEIDGVHASFCLFMNLADQNLPVASGVWDNHGRLSLIRIFDSGVDCIKAFKEWEHTRLSKEEISNLGKISRDFSSYIRLENKLGVYFG